MRTTADLRRRILNRTARIVVIGQGYVGVSLACVAAEAGFSVTGVDVDARRVAELTEGRMVIAGVDEGLARSALATGRLAFGASAEAVAEAHLVFVCVPTPLHDGTPDLTFVERACSDVASKLAPGTLVVLESSTYPGTTEEFVKPLLETSGLTAGRDFLLAYSPERIGPATRSTPSSDVPTRSYVEVSTRSPLGSRSCSTSSWSTRSWPCRPVAPQSSRSSWRTRSGM